MSGNNFLASDKILATGLTDVFWQKMSLV